MKATLHLPRRRHDAHDRPPFARIARRARGASGLEAAPHIEWKKRRPQAPDAESGSHALP
ncbi:hypothetical protein [Solimonas soli]|uniref:hypothetical protein n=1 Tax=Solimonas soli TaxID=413479 RepID=UPI000486B403|nr:hypothetical protein [Solimonas soli]